MARKQDWVPLVSLTSVLIAVASSVVSFLMASASSTALLQKNEALLAQNRASDQWAYFQAKSIKGNIAEAFGQQFSNPFLQQEAGRYDQEAATIQTAAQEYENEVKQASRLSAQASAKSTWFNVSLTILQAAIALCAIAIVMKRKEVWYVALGISCIALGIVTWVF